MERQKEELKKQHPVPQNIMEVEFKLVGDMTLRQFGYVAAGAVIGYLIYAQPITGIIRWPLILTDVALALGFAFLPMEERGLDEWFKNFFSAVYTPTQRIWKQTSGTALTTTTTGKPKKKKDSAVAKAAKTEQKKRKKETDEEKKKEEVKKLSKELKETVEETKKEKPRTEKDLEKKAASITKELDKLLKTMGGDRNEGLSEKELREENRLLKSRLVTIGEQYKKLKELEGAEETPANLKQTISYYKDQLETMEEKNRALQEELQKSESQNGSVVEEKKEEQKKLEEKLKTMEENNNTLEEKIKNLQEQIKKFEEKTSQLHSKNKKYFEELQEKEKELRSLEKDRTRAVSKMMELKSKLEGKSYSPEKKIQPEEQEKKEEAKSAKEEGKTPEKKKEAKPEERLRKERETAPIINNIPNIINGVVKDKNGDLIEGIMVIIEDTDGDPVRALKTNKLGQFAVSTPLPNGTYTVKVSSGNYKPAKVTTDGSVLDPVVFRERT